MLFFIICVELVWQKNVGIFAIKFP